MQSSDRLANVAGYLLTAILIVAAFMFKLTGAVLAGMLVYSLSLRVRDAIKRRYGHLPAQRLALGLVILVVASVVFGAVLALSQLVKGQHGIADMTTALAQGLSRLHDALPPMLAPYLPSTLDSARVLALNYLRTYSATLSAVGMGTVRALAHILIGIVLGGMLAWSTFGEARHYAPLSASLLTRLSNLRRAFERVVFAQVRISLINTALSGIYLAVVLPLCGVHVPFTGALVGFTFAAGLIPVVGNLISNAAIVLASAAASWHAAIASLVYLVLVHKLEYFVNARVVGHSIKAHAWEIILSMVVMEAIVGFPGVVVAPILYAFVKGELTDAGFVGRRRATREVDERVTVST